MTQPASVATRSGHPKITYEEFLQWDGENQHVEWVDGEVVEMAPVGDVHQELGGWLIALLTFFTQSHQLGVIRYEPFQMKTGTDLPGRAPDVLFVAKKNLSRIKTNYLDGPADLVIEIISPGSGAIDRGEKYSEYERGGVREYWLLDPKRKQADFYELGRDHLYHRMPIQEGIVRSKVLKGLWLEVSWLWAKPIPAASEIWEKWQKQK